MQLNSLVPDFALPDQSGQMRRLSDYRGQVVIVNFCSAECPWSERADRLLVALAAQSPGRVALLAIAANTHETDEMLLEAVRQRGLAFILRDTGRVADSFQAQTTPQVFIIDQSGFLRYRGAIDDVTFRKREPERFYAAEAVTALTERRLPEIRETPAYGCAIVRM